MIHSDIAKASATLKEGGLVSMPTETVYGLAGNALSDHAVAAIYALKGRPDFNPLIVHGTGKAMLEAFVEFTPLAEKLAAHFWPGALTLVMKRKAGCALSLLVSAGLDTVAVRVPSHKVAQALLREAGVPLAAPSANRSGRVSPTSAEHVTEEFAGSNLSILEGGQCVVGIESTVIDVTGDTPVLLRYGFITPKMVQEVAGSIKFADAHSPLSSPGMLKSHYAPSVPVRLNVLEPLPTEALLAFGAGVPQGAKVVFNLSLEGDTQEAAAHLFAAMRRFDLPEFSAIAVMPIPDDGLGLAINDRLRRAAG